jgi:hypothetical protein
MVATEPVPRVSELAPETPKPLARALELATEFEFEDRCPSSAELEALLEDALWEQGARAEKQAIEELRERVGTATGGSLSRSAKNMAMQDSGARTPWSVRLDPSSPGSASGIRAAPGTPTSFGEPTSGFTPPPSVTLGSAGPSTAPPVDGAPTSVTNVASTAEARVATAAPRGSLRMVGMIVALILGALAAVVFVRWPGDAPDGAPRDRATGTGVGSADDLAASDTSAASTAAPPATQVVTDAGPTASGSAPPSSSTAPSPVGVHGSPPVRPPPAAASADEESTEPGTLQVVAIPWANVSVDGRPLGVTPVAPVSLPPGTHTVVLVNSELGATRTMSVTIKPGKPSLLRVDLKRTSP